MKKLIHLLGVQSVTELLKNKSFFLLIFGLILLDRVIKTFTGGQSKPPGIEQIKTLGTQVGPWVFEQFPLELAHWFSQGQIFVLLAGLFLLKQLISIWPSSDMRRMHRDERHGFGLFGSLMSLKFDQLWWDLIAAGSLVALTSVWGSVVFFGCQTLWFQFHQLWVVGLLGVMLFLVAPVILGGLSFSSKLAVLHQGSFKRKLILYFQLFCKASFFWRAWVFFSLRTILEGLFVAIIPAMALLWIESYGLRLAVAAVSATPVYSFVKMASFKFFLYLYQYAPEVKEEYSQYYDQWEV